MYRAVYYAANRGKEMAYNAVYRKNHRAELRTRAAAYSIANLDKRLINEKNRNARKKSNGGVLSHGLAAKLFKLQKGKCACCNKPLGPDFHMDHMIPLALGGPNTDDNIQLLRSTCNRQKHASNPVDFMQSRGYLI